MTPLRALIVDDEPIARSHLRSLLAGRDDVVVIGECGDGVTAATRILAERPDLVLLDVQMPERSGVDVVRTVGADQMPWTIFITAFDDHAIEAFDVHAIDYVLKPVNRERFHRAVDRVVKLHATRAPAAPALRELVGAGGPGRVGEGRLAVRAGDRVIYLRVADLDWVEAAGDHVRFHVSRQVYEHRITMAQLERRLPTAKFARIHRSVIVNLDRVVEFQPWFHGDWIVVLADGTRLQSGKSYRARLRELTAG